MIYVFVVWIGWCMTCTALVTVAVIAKGYIFPDHELPDGTGIVIVILGLILGSFMTGVTLL